MAQKVVEGAVKLERQLDDVLKVFEGKNMELAATAGMLEIINEAKSLAPFLSGTLRRSLHIGSHTNETPEFRPGSDIGGSYSDIRGSESTRNSAEVAGGTNLVYAATQEFGRPEANIRPQAYLRPAYDRKKRDALDQTALAILDLLEAAV